MISRRVLEPVPAAEPSLDEALDKLLAMSFTKTENDRVPTDTLQLKGEAPPLKREVVQEVHEELIMPLDRRKVQPDTTGCTRDGASTREGTITRDGSVMSGHIDGHRELMDWADVELNMCLQDGLDGSMTPYTERPYTDGSMTPMTEASWMDESLDGSSCPGTPDAAMDLPLLQPATMDRVSASGHVWDNSHHTVLFCTNTRRNNGVICYSYKTIFLRWQKWLSLIPKHLFEKLCVWRYCPYNVHIWMFAATAVSYC